MPDRRASRFAAEVLFLIALAVGLALADVEPILIAGIMAVGWLLVALLEWLASREEPHYGSGLPPRYYVPQVSLPPPRPLEQVASGYPDAGQREDAPTWIAPAALRADLAGAWPVAAPTAGEDTQEDDEAVPALEPEPVVEAVAIAEAQAEEEPALQPARQDDAEPPVEEDAEGAEETEPVPEAGEAPSALRERDLAVAPEVAGAVAAPGAVPDDVLESDAVPGDSERAAGGAAPAGDAIVDAAALAGAAAVLRDDDGRAAADAASTPEALADDESAAATTDDHAVVGATADEPAEDALADVEAVPPAAGTTDEPDAPVDDPDTVVDEPTTIVEEPTTVVVAPASDEGEEPADDTPRRSLWDVVRAAVTPASAAAVSGAAVADDEGEEPPRTLDDPQPAAPARSLWETVRAFAAPAAAVAAGTAAAKDDPIARERDDEAAEAAEAAEAEPPGPRVFRLLGRKAVESEADALSDPLLLDEADLEPEGRRPPDLELVPPDLPEDDRDDPPPVTLTMPRRSARHRLDPLAETGSRRWPWQRASADSGAVAEVPARPVGVRPLPGRSRRHA